MPTALPKSLGSGEIPSTMERPSDDPFARLNTSSDTYSSDEDDADSILNSILHNSNNTNDSLGKNRVSCFFKPPEPDRWTDILQKLMTRDLDSTHLLDGTPSFKMQKKNQQLIFLHPEDGNRDYTDEELEASQERDFETRLFMTSTSSCGGDSVFLRTHHSDNHPHESGVYNFVRDMLKASKHKNTHTAAKSTLTRLLNIALDMPESDYRTFAITMASGLSCYGSNTSFELKGSNDVNAILRESQSPEILRAELCILMHIMFTKIQKYNFMVEEGGSNSYRLIYCRLQTSKEKAPYGIAIFSFVFQIVLTLYVFLQFKYNFVGKEEICDFDNNDDCMPYNISNWKMLPLATLTTIYSALLAYPIMNEIPDAWNIFGSYGILQMMDFIVNGILPSVLLLFGFFVIWGQGSYIEAVLNTAALLFVPQIDDELPQLLGLKPDLIVKNFLIKETIDEFNKLHHKDYATRKRLKLKYYSQAKKEGLGVQFADHIITNMVEQGSDPSEGFLFQPFQVRQGEEEGDHQIDPCCFVTENCLIRKISWRFTVFKPNPNTSRPRIGYLKIETLLGDTIVFNRTEEDLVTLGQEYSLKGVYLITNFQMSQDILRLRVCGSRNSRDFQTAFDYYTLWPITDNAKKLLKREEEFDTTRYSVSTRALVGYSTSSGIFEKV